jgi:hypothetical protein
MSVTENKVDFNGLEQLAYKYFCKLGCEWLKEQLESYDTELSKNRDKSLYRHKGFRQSTIKTIMGEVEYSRTIYEVIDGGGIKKYVYLLDEKMGINGSGFISGLLSGIIVKAACESPYRSAARMVSETTGQTISHTGAWNVVQKVGQCISMQEDASAKAAAKNQGTGELTAPVLFEEFDGIWLKLQGGSRKKHGKSREMKLSIAYDGAREIYPKRYQLTNKIACAGFLSVDEFVRRKEGIVAGTYNTDEIGMRLLNGDGASWVQSTYEYTVGITDEDVHFQLDSYHANEAIRTYVKSPGMRKMITGLYYAKKTDELLESIFILSESAVADDEQENLLKLYTYFLNNKDELIPCHRRGLPIPRAPLGKVYSRLGAMESNVFTLVGNRMKGRRFCWSIDGGNNLAKLLCLKVTGKLSDALQNLTAVTLPEKYADELITGFSAAKMPVTSGKGYDGYHKTTAPSTPDYKWLRGIGTPKPFTEMSFR